MSDKLRPHQEDGLRVFDDALLSERRTPIVYYVTMGGGKTRMYAEASAHAWDAKRINTMAYVPTKVIAASLARAMTKAGLKPTVLNKNAGPFFESDRNVVISTYSKLALQPDIHRHQVGKAPTLVICDEIHHCGSSVEDPNDVTRFGYGVECVYSEAAMTIYGTGTPYRSDSRVLPGLEYTDPDPKTGTRYVKADITLTISEALGYGYIRPIVFKNYSDKREVTRAEVSGLDTRSIANTQKSLTAICRDPANWHPLIDQCADSCNGRMLVIATDIPHAQSIQARIEQRFGKLEPMLVTSDDDGAADMLAAFDNSSSRCLVTVGMASEGFDCPSLTHLVYLSPNRTQLALDQGTGRVIRNEPERDAYVYGPGDSQWNLFRDQYEDEKRVGLALRNERLERERLEREQSDIVTGYVRSDGPTGLETSVGGESVPIDAERISTDTGIDLSVVSTVLRAEANIRNPEVEPVDDNSDSARKLEGKRVFGKKGVIPNLNFKLVGRTEPSFLIRATAKRYASLHGGKPTERKPYPVKVTKEYERIAIRLATGEDRPSWFTQELEAINARNN